jgi:hypothetical protein
VKTFFFNRIKQQKKKLPFTFFFSLHPARAVFLLLKSFYSALAPLLRLTMTTEITFRVMYSAHSAPNFEMTIGPDGKGTLTLRTIHEKFNELGDYLNGNKKPLTTVLRNHHNHVVFNRVSEMDLKKFGIDEGLCQYTFYFEKFFALPDFGSYMKFRGESVVTVVPINAPVLYDAKRCELIPGSIKFYSAPQGRKHELFFKYFSPSGLEVVPNAIKKEIMEKYFPKIDEDPEMDQDYLWSCNSCPLYAPEHLPSVVTKCTGFGPNSNVACIYTGVRKTFVCNRYFYGSSYPNPQLLG